MGAYRDARGDGRYLRVTWHPGPQMFVLSVWRDDVCTATFQMRPDTSAEIIGDLAGVLGASVSIAWPQPQTGPQTQPQASA